MTVLKWFRKMYKCTYIRGGGEGYSANVNIGGTWAKGLAGVFWLIFATFLKVWHYFRIERIIHACFVVFVSSVKLERYPGTRTRTPSRSSCRTARIAWCGLSWLCSRWAFSFSSITHAPLVPGWLRLSSPSPVHPYSLPSFTQCLEIIFSKQTR